MKRILSICCAITLILHMVPPVGASAINAESDSLGEQVLSRSALATLSSTEVEGVLKTKNGTFLRETVDGNYIILEKNTASLENETILSQQLAPLDIPDELKESIIKKYRVLAEQGSTQGATVDIYIGTQKLSPTGRSFLDDYDTETHKGRQFKVVPVYFNNMTAEKRIYEGKATRNFLDQCTDLIATILGTDEDAPLGQTIFLKVFGVGQTFLEWIEAILDLEVSGSTNDYHDFEMSYSATHYFYYLYSDALNSWNRVLSTQSVDIDHIDLQTYTYVQTASNRWEGKNTVITHDNIALLKTPSFENPFEVAIKYQFSGFNEEISFKYEGYTVYF